MANDNIPIETLYKFLYHDYKEEQKKNKELLVELGKEKAYSQELEEKLKILEQRISSNLEENREVLKEIKQEEAYKNIRILNQDLRERLRSMKQARDNAISKMNEYKKQLDFIQSKKEER